MSNLLWKSFVVSPAVLTAVLLVSTTAIAAQNATHSKAAKAEASTTENQQLSPSASELASSSIFEVTKTEALPSEKQQLSTSVAALATPSTGVKIAQKSSETLAQSSQTEVNVLKQVNSYSNEGQSSSQSQVTSVSQFSDVQPTDWAFQALQSLVERYGCIAGYPNGTFRGNRALTRYEFAAGLNACLDRVNELIATATSDLVRKEDLATLQRLQDEFAAELATLRGRVDALEARTAELEANQFSTTTKLAGEAIFALSAPLINTSSDRNRAVLQDRVRLDLQTSFTGKDVLHTRLATGNGGFNNRFDLGTRAVGPAPGFTTSEGTQTFNITGNGTTNNNNSVSLDWLSYYVPIGPAQLYIAATGGTHSDYAPTLNPYFEDFDGGNGALSTFASRNPIYNIGGGAGGALNIKFGKGGLLRPSSITLGYLASNPNNPGLGSGVFNGNYAALGQINFNITDRFALAATYVHGYLRGGSAIFDEGGTLAANTPIVGTAQANRVFGAAEVNSYGVEGAFRLSNKISLSAFGTYSDVSGKVSRQDDFQAWTYGGGVAFPDLGKKGNVLGLFAGAEPYARNRRGFAGSDTPIHVEGFYKYRVSDNISITPGVIYLISPGQNSNNDDVLIGTLRTTFTF
jgi:hypothetical protein